MDIGTKDLRRRLSEILDRVARGEHVIVHRRGRLTVTLVPRASRLPSLAEFRGVSREPARSGPVAERGSRRRPRARARLIRYIDTSVLVAYCGSVFRDSRRSRLSLNNKSIILPIGTLPLPGAEGS